MSDQKIEADPSNVSLSWMDQADDPAKLEDSPAPQEVVSQKIEGDPSDVSAALYLPQTGAPGADDPPAPQEVVELPVESARNTPSITAPLNFIGGPTGTQHLMRGWLSGKVITRIRVFRERTRIQAYTIWLSGDNGVTFGKPGTTESSEYTFADGELITSLTLWGDGMGTRAGYIRFTTSKGNTFAYGMDTNRLRTPYPADVGSGICVGAIFNAADDIHAHGFYFLNHVENAELTSLRYPTLQFDSMGISPHSLRRFRYRNSSASNRNWVFSDEVSETKTSSWSNTSGLSIHASTTVSGGIPFVAEVQGQFGWQVSASSTHTESEELKKEFSWDLSGEAHPGDFVDVEAVTRMGKLNIPYQGTMRVRLKNGTSFTYTLNGWYKGVDFSDVTINYP